MISHPFDPEEKIIEFAMAEKEKKRLIDMSLKSFHGRDSL